MDSFISWILNSLEPIFFIVAGLSLAGVALPRWLLVFGGVCGLLAGVLAIA